MVLQHRFIVGDVQSCIMSLGELYQAGWHTESCIMSLGELYQAGRHIDKDGDDLFLLPPDDIMKVPVFGNQSTCTLCSRSSTRRRG